MRLAHVNDAFCTLVGLRAEQLLGTGWINTIHEDDLDGVIEQVAAALDGEEVETQARLVRDDGAVRTTVIRFSHLFTPGVGAGFVGTIEDITDRLAFEAKLAHQANHDPLTGLPNRTLLAQYVAERFRPRRRRPGLPLPRPRQLQGRQRLARAHRRRRAARRGGEPAARHGAPRRPGRPLRRRRVRRRLRERRRGRRRRPRRPRVRGARPADAPRRRRHPPATPASASTVQTASTPRPSELIRDCDIAMYQAKAGGKGRITVLDQQARAEARDKLRLVAELRRRHRAPRDHAASTSRSSTPSTADPVAVEALARWEHPRARRRSARPTFVPLAEESGLISALGLLVLDETCRQLAEWDHLLGAAAPPRANVNVSALQLDDNLAGQVAAGARAAPARPRADLASRSPSRP